MRDLDHSQNQSDMPFLFLSKTNVTPNIQLKPSSRMWWDILKQILYILDLFCHNFFTCRKTTWVAFSLVHSYVEQTIWFGSYGPKQDPCPLDTEQNSHCHPSGFAVDVRGKPRLEADPTKAQTIIFTSCFVHASLVRYIDYLVISKLLDSLAPHLVGKYIIPGSKPLPQCRRTCSRNQNLMNPRSETNHGIPSSCYLNGSRCILSWLGYGMMT